MVEPAKREPTMEEIVVALRETRKAAGSSPPLTLVSNPAPDENAGATSLADLRDQEIERLLAENARLNERTMSILRRVEREQVRDTEAAIVRAVREALDAELRPVMLTLLRLIERQRALAPDAHDATWIVDLEQENRT